MTERVMESVVSGHGALLIEQERAGDGMLLKKLPRLPHAIAFSAAMNANWARAAAISGIRDSN